MIYYYAYCSTHGKVGDSRQDSDTAENDVLNHINEGGNHGQVYVKMVQRKGNSGAFRYNYKRFKK